MFLSNFSSALILPSILVFLLISYFMSTSDFSDVSMLSDPTTLPFDAPLRASKGLIAGYCLLWDLGSEWLRGLRRILPIFRPIQMSKEPHAKQPQRKIRNLCEGSFVFSFKPVYFIMVAPNIFLPSIYFSFLYPGIRKDGNIYCASPLSWWVCLFITQTQNTKKQKTHKHKKHKHRKHKPQNKTLLKVQHSPKMTEMPHVSSGYHFWMDFKPILENLHIFALPWALFPFTQAQKQK